MSRLKLSFAPALAALMLALPAAPQTGGNSAGLLPPDQLFAPPQPVKFQALYNEASQCSGLTAQLQANAAMYAARALTESTRARRAGDAQTAADLQAIFVNGTTLRSTASGAHQSLEGLRTALAGRSDVGDAGGRVLFLAGGRGVTPLNLDSLSAGGPALVEDMIHRGEILLADLDRANACLSAVSAVDVTAP